MQRRAARLLLAGRTVECPCCGGRFRHFMAYGIRKRPNAMCPRCASLERHRLLWLYLRDETDIASRERVLHIAPEPAIKRNLARMIPRYVTGDLDSPLAEERVDVTAMEFDDRSFDVVLCNHVLEHVPEDWLAISELRRVLAEDGWAVLQAPVDERLAETFEDPTITDPGERERLFGNHDHVRQYGRDYVQRLEQAGFTVEVIRYADRLSDQQRARFGLDRVEPIYLCRGRP